MYLKSLVLKGFVVADRSALTLEPGITAVSGSQRVGQVEHLGRRSVGARRAQRQEPARPGHGGRPSPAPRRARPPVSPRSISCSTIPTARCRSISTRWQSPGACTATARASTSSTAPWPGAWTCWTSCTTRAWAPAPFHHPRARSTPSCRASRRIARALIEGRPPAFSSTSSARRKAAEAGEHGSHLLRARDVVGEVARQLGPLERKAKKGAHLPGARGPAG